MFNFKEAFSYLFKEKKWGLKFAVAYIVTALITIPSGISSMIRQSSVTTSLTTLNKLNSYNYYTTNNPTTTISLLLTCFILIFIIPFLIITLWYVYENVQAAIQNRQTKGIWENDFGDTIKKAGKYFVVSFVYGLIFVLIALAILAIVGGVFCLGYMLLMKSSTTGLNTSTSDFQTFFGIWGLFVCCLAIVFIPLAVIAYLFITPAVLRLIGTNTLNEGLKFGENWKIGKKYMGTFIGLFLFNIAYGIIIAVLSGASSFITLPMYLSVPVVGIVLEIIVQLVLGLLTTYFAYFVYPRLLGQAFRSIVKKEESLKYIDVGSD